MQYFKNKSLKDGPKIFRAMPGRIPEGIIAEPLEELPEASLEKFLGSFQINPREDL